MLENDVLMEKSTVQIQQEEASEEYIKRFPTKLHEMLKDSRVRDKFFKSISKEYADIIVYRGIHFWETWMKQSCMIVLSGNRHFKCAVFQLMKIRCS